MLAVMLTACGRIGFDVDAGATGNGETCETAQRITIGVPLVVEIAGATDEYAGTACGNGPERVFAWEETASAMRTVRIEATFNGSYSLDLTCPPTINGSCVTFSPGSSPEVTRTVEPGLNYVVIDQLGGPGTTLTIRVE
jgi:hypothetical protein